MPGRRKALKDLDTAKVETRERKIILKLTLLQFRRRLAKSLRLLKNHQADLIEVSFRGRPLVYVTPAAPPPPAPLPPPPSPKKLKAGKFRF